LDNGTKPHVVDTARSSSIISRMNRAPIALIAAALTWAMILGATTMPNPIRVPDLAAKPWTLDHGGVIRGDTSQKKLALIFTGGDFGEGTLSILDTLKRERIHASFFFTGDYLRKPQYQEGIKRIVAEGHYLGPHSDSHPLYCPWEDREKTLVTREFFQHDLQKNIDALRAYGALPAGKVVYFIPPYEWFNQDQADWARQMGVLLFNFTPGSGSNRDWAPEGHKSFVPSKQIISDILKYEQKDPHGLNGFLLLLHVGSERKDKTFPLLGSLIEELKKRGYDFARVDELLMTTP
jgi:peptidoglycan/xylan/chitin deacetylase (PgdA/CDA1 family)